MGLNLWAWLHGRLGVTFGDELLDHATAVGATTASAAAATAGNTGRMLRVAHGRCRAQAFVQTGLFLQDSLDVGV